MEEAKENITQDMQASIAGTEQAGEVDVKELKNEIAELTKTIDKLEFENQELEEKVYDLTKEVEDLKGKDEIAQAREAS